MKKIIKRILCIILILAMTLGIGVLLQYLLFDDVQSYSRLMMHDLYEAPENLDILFVGSSHVRRGFDTEVTDEVFGENTFNLSTASQRLDGSLALIKEACSLYKVKQIYLDLYYGVVDVNDYDTRRSMTETYLVSDYMRPSWNKLELLLHASSMKYYSNGFLPFRRNWEDIFDLKYLTDLYARKHTETYQNYDWFVIDTHDFYGGKGYFGNTVKVPEDTYWNDLAYGPVGIQEQMQQDSDWMNTLREIVSFCERKQVPLTFIMVPEPEWTLAGKGDYQEFSDWIRSLAEQMQVPYYDFNLCRPEYFDIEDRSLFFDADHLNDEGAAAFSTVFGQFFTGQIPEEELFYDSFEEAILDSEPAVYGIAGPVKSDTGERLCSLITNRLSGMEYRITATSSETGEQKLIQDFCSNLEFVLPYGESGSLEVQWRSADREEEQSFNCSY